MAVGTTGAGEGGALEPPNFKARGLTVQNYLCLKFSLAKLKTFSDVFVAKILLENV